MEVMKAVKMVDDDLPGGQWDRLLAAASSRLEFQLPATKMATPHSQRTIFETAEVKEIKDLSQTESEIVGILASIATSSAPVTAPSPAETIAAVPTETTPNINRPTNPQPRLPTPPQLAKQRKPAAKSRKKPGTTTTKPRNRPKATPKPSNKPRGAMKEEQEPRMASPATTQPSISALPPPTTSTTKPLVAAYENMFSVPFRCCPVEVPDLFLSLLDSPARPASALLKPFSRFRHQLCFAHVHRFAEMTAAYAFDEPARFLAYPPSPCGSNDGVGMSHTPQLSLITDAEAHRPLNRPRSNGCDSPYYSCVLDGAHDGHAPILNIERDEDFRQQVMREMEARMEQKDLKSHGDVADRLVYSILQNCKPPSPDEAYLLSGEEAAARVEAGISDCPIFTQGQQQFKWDPSNRPIAELFKRMEDLNRSVSVQIPSRKAYLQSFQKQRLCDVQKRFMESYNMDTDDPWNVLDLRNPLPPAVLPKFLTGENCQLLPRVRDAVLNGSCAERTVAAKEQWNEWVDVLDWVLMSEGGHNTAPHMDSHGLSTWITVQEGEFGYGWLSKPTKEERDAWIAHPQEFVGGQWRFTVLTPGQTVFFNSGTVHFVFRIRNGQTMALGGHVLQWSGLAHWMDVIQDELRNPQITNEDMEWSAPKYIRVIADLVENRLQNGRVEGMGGMEAVQKFLAAVKVRFPTRSDPHHKTPC